MALDYLTIPGKSNVISSFIHKPDCSPGLTATSIEVERLFSRGRLIISHVRSRLGVQNSRALICLGIWSRLGLVKDTDIKAVTGREEAKGTNQLDNGWDAIQLE
jgi:hypothetical protein